MKDVVAEESKDVENSKSEDAKEDKKDATNVEQKETNKWKGSRIIAKFSLSSIL